MAIIAAVAPNGTDRSFPAGVPPIYVHKASIRYDGFVLNTTPYLST